VALADTLVLRALGLGDLLTGVPALRALRRARPEHRLVLAAPAVLAPLAALTGAVDAVLDQPGLEHPLRTERPALAVNLHGRGPRSTALLRALGPGELWSFDDGGPQWRDGEHEVDRWGRLLRFHGVTADPGDLFLDRPGIPSPAPGAVVIHPGAASGARRWPVARFAAVAAALRADGHRVVVTGGPSERDLVSAVAALGAEPVGTDLSELAALVAGAALVVCGDTGVAHLATAYGTPSVLLFGPTPPAEWGPRSGPHTVLWKGDGRSDPHGADPDPALLALSVPDVLTAARRWVRATAASSQ
jgi:ADP-heptose:LPS heptosyltransferase